MLTIVIILQTILLIVLGFALARIASSYNSVFNKFQKDTKVAARSGRHLKGAQRIVDEERLLLRQKLDEVVAAESGGFQKILQEAREDAKKIFLEVSSQSRAEVKADLTSFRSNLDARVAQEVKAVQDELKAYKDQKKVELDQKAKVVLSQAAMQVLGTTIAPEKHEEIIKKALERAKAENFF